MVKMLGLETAWFGFNHTVPLMMLWKNSPWKRAYSWRTGVGMGSPCGLDDEATKEGSSSLEVLQIFQE